MVRLGLAQVGQKQCRVLARAVEHRCGLGACNLDLGTAWRKGRADQSARRVRARPQRRAHLTCNSTPKWDVNSYAGVKGGIVERESKLADEAMRTKLHEKFREMFPDLAAHGAREGEHAPIPLESPTGQPAREWTDAERQECARVVGLLVQREHEAE